MNPVRYALGVSLGRHMPLANVAWLMRSPICFPVLVLQTSKRGDVNALAV